MIKRVFLSVCVALLLLLTIRPTATGGTWSALTHAPSVGIAHCNLLTDGRVMCQRFASNEWYALTPDSSGSYANGTWTQLASMDSTYKPLYYASAVLPDGRLLIEGGEYLCTPTCSYTATNKGAIYDPASNTWTNVTAPSGWSYIGNGMSVVLPNGTYMLMNCCSDSQPALLDASNLTWSFPTLSQTQPDDYPNEESLVMLPNGKFLNVEQWYELYTGQPGDFKISTLYDPASPGWSTPVTTGIELADNDRSTPKYLVGPGMLQPNGTVFWVGASGDANSTANTGIYDPSTDSWSAGPTIPNHDGGNDGISSVLVDGKVFFAGSPNPVSGPISPTRFYEYDGTSITQVSNPTTCSTSCTYPVYVTGMVALPSGQILYTNTSTDVQLYTPAGTPSSGWKPTISSVAAQLVPGSSYTISGTQFNGLNSGVQKINSQSATNYPLVRLTNVASGHITYAKTHGHSTMQVQTGSSTVSTVFDVPSGVELGATDVQVVTNGIASTSTRVLIGGVLNRTQGGSSSSATTIVGGSQTHTAGHALVALISVASGAGTVSSISNTASDSWTSLGSYTDSVTTNMRYEIWYVTSTAGATNDQATATLSASSTNRSITVYEVYGQKVSSMAGNTSSNASTGTAISSGSVTTTDPYEVIFSVGRAINTYAPCNRCQNQAHIVGTNGFTLSDFTYPSYAQVLTYFDEYKVVTASAAATATAPGNSFISAFAAAIRFN
jgi:hypothetical protein